MTWMRTIRRNKNLKILGFNVADRSCPCDKKMFFFSKQYTIYYTNDDFASSTR